MNRNRLLKTLAAAVLTAGLSAGIAAPLTGSPSADTGWGKPQVLDTGWGFTAADTGWG